jgi:hypothetical protein
MVINKIPICKNLIRFHISFVKTYQRAEFQRLGTPDSVTSMPGARSGYMVQLLKLHSSTPIIFILS